MTKRVLLMMIAGIAAGAGQARAQQAAAPKVQIEVDGNFITATRTFTDTAAPLIHAEAGQITASYDVPRTAAFSAGAFVRVWRQLSAGATYGRSSRSTAADITASLPHPFFFSRTRQIEGTESNAKQQDSTVAMLLRASFPAFKQTTVSAFGGPAWLSVRQGVIERVNYSETYPYDTASYTSATVRNAEHTQLTFLVGGDVTYYFSKRIGAGAGLKYAAANVELPSLDSDVLTIKAGGLAVTTGIRFRF